MCGQHCFTFFFCWFLLPCQDMLAKIFFGGVLSLLKQKKPDACQNNESSETMHSRSDTVIC